MSRPILSVAFVVCGVLVASACASQAEGERCDTRSGNDDCETGLVCTPVSGLAIGSQLTTGANQQSTANLGLCCPPSGDRSRQPVEACFPSTSTPGAGGSPGSGGADSGSASGGAGGGDSGAATGGAATGGTTGSGGAAPSDAATDGKG